MRGDDDGNGICSYNTRYNIRGTNRGIIVLPSVSSSYKNAAPRATFWPPGVPQNDHIIYIELQKYLTYD